MTRPLPPQPNLDQLRHQAKDLLRRHGRGDASARECLRHLREFSDLSNQDLDQASLKLHQAQYALAMDYGFGSWDAMKKHVGSPSATEESRIETRDGATVLRGLEHIVIGSDSGRQNSVLACLTAALQSQGVEITYTQLMGLSGGAFRLQYSGCPSAACAQCGFDLVEQLAGVLDVAIRSYGTDKHCASDAAHQRNRSRQAARVAVAESIQRGIPALWNSEECGLVVGHRGRDEWLVRKYSQQDSGYKSVSGWPWGFLVLRPGPAPRVSPEMYIDSLRLAVRLHQSPAIAEYASGRAAYDRWIRYLLRDDYAEDPTVTNWFGRALRNGSIYGTLFCARQLAEEYLRDAAEVLGKSGQADAATGLNQAAAEARRHWQHMDKPREGFACPWSLQPWHIGELSNWTHAVRQTQAQALEELAQIDDRMFASIQRAIETL